MELSILAVFLTSFILSVASHPKHSDVIPKDYYKRQILQPIPGYIPVYIKADGVPIVRSEIKKHIPDVNSQKVSEPKEKQLLRETEEKGSKLSESQTPLPNLQEKLKAPLDKTKTERKLGDSQRNFSDLKPLVK